MSMSDEDWARDQAITDLHAEAVWERAVREQPIFLFVEGDSEEAAIPLLFEQEIDLEKLGVRVANYNGHGNLRAALRLLKKALVHERPVIVTHDNDPASVDAVRKCRAQGLIDDLVFVAPIPDSEVVEYKSGHLGGSFEESFPPETFVAASFEGGVLPEELGARRREFEVSFDQSKPWMAQLARFATQAGIENFAACKPALAERLVDQCEELPPTYKRLVDLVRSVRDKHPVVHPDDVELPKVRGLTYFPETSR